MPARYRFLLIGLVLAPVFSLTPLLQYMGWFLGSLTHEMGHTAVAWAAGCPAFPAIRLDGHAAAIHQAQSLPLALAVWCGLGYLAWQRRGAWFALPAVYPLFAFTGLREFFFLCGGHLGELTFAAIFFWRALVGGYTDSASERAAHATVAWFLFFRNLFLSGGLLLSEAARAAYAANGSFGLRNDYIRIADDLLGVDLGVVAFFSLVLVLLVPAAAWFIAERRRKVCLVGSPAEQQEEHRHHHHDRSLR